MPNVLQPGAFVWFEKTQVPLVKVLLVPGWRPRKQLAVRVHFLRCGGLLNDWSVEDFRSLGLGSNPGEDIDVCKCIVPSRYEGTLNSRRATSSREVGGRGRDVGVP
ncbi:uncharacterized protein TNCV_2826611 [Trichonephila clavipes]|nr:uncharacterized protein TNCV_2826611 [Trichonephila clavipes]